MYKIHSSVTLTSMKTEDIELKKGSKITDIISVAKKGFAFVDTQEGIPDIFIAPPNVGHALTGDIVEVEILGAAEKDRLEGKVLRVVEENKRKFVGEIVKQDGMWVLDADSKRMHVPILILGDIGDLKEGVKAFVEITGWQEKADYPHGEIREILGPKGEHEVEMKAILLERGIDSTFPPHVEKEAQKIRESYSVEEGLKEDRRDLRDLPTFTIDPDTAKDFDDALSFRDLENGRYEIGVHIADVAHFVTPKSALDEEARKRSFSTYLVDRTIPMLPEVLSNDLCSLNPNEDKFAFTALFEVDKDGQIHSRWFGRSVIHSDRRFTYEEAQEVLESGEGDFAQEIAVLWDIAQKVRKRRFKTGAIEFQSEEVKFELDDNGKPIAIRIKESIDTNHLIEEYMLLANQETALEVKRLAKKYSRDLLFIYRVHDEPDREKLEMLAVFLRALGYDFDLPKGEITGELLNDLLNRVEEKPEEGMINTTMIRSMAKAEYSTKNNGHFGLGFSYYTHFTSPIRRYPDILVHRLLWKHLHNEIVPNQEYGFYEKTAQLASAREIEVTQAERESIKFKQVEYLEDKVGETFDVIITGASDRGLFVEEKETKANGYISVQSLEDDYYTYNEKTYSLVGSKTGRTFRLGDEIKVKLTKVNIDDREIDFVVVDK